MKARKRSERFPKNRKAIGGDQYYQDLNCVMVPWHVCMPNFIQLYILDIYSLLYANYTPIKLSDGLNNWILHRRKKLKTWKRMLQRVGGV